MVNFNILFLPTVNLPFIAVYPERKTNKKGIFERYRP